MVQTIRIDDALWDASPAERRADWRTTIVDLLDDGGLVSAHTRLVVRSAGPDVHLALDGGAEPTTFAVEAASVRALISEYLHVIRRMQDEEVAESSAKMQALDMAKKVVHDKGGKALAAAAPGLAASHETYRRLFTLVVTVLVDVTALPGARAHRRHASL
jgi:uncharacterized protein (UPF0262 family)